MPVKKSSLQAVLIQAEVEERARQDQLRSIQQRFEKEQQQMLLLEEYFQGYQNDATILSQSHFEPQKRQHYIEMLQQLSVLIAQQENILKQVQAEKAQAETKCYEAELYCQKLRDSVNDEKRRLLQQREKKNQNIALEEMLTRKR